MFGLGRGSRWKAYFAFKWLFSEEYLSGLASGHSFFRVISEVRGKIGKRRAQPAFC